MENIYFEYRENEIRQGNLMTKSRYLDRMRKGIRISSRILLFLLAVIILFLTCIPASSTFAKDSSERKTLKVGYMDYNGFITKQSDGTFVGYGAEYLAEISKYSDYDFEYVYGNWPDLLTKLKEGEIDLLCTAQYSDERAAIYDYSAYPIGYTQGILYGTENCTTAYEDFAAFNGQKVGIIKNSEMLAMFERYEEQNDFTTEITEYDSEDELERALNDGLIDMMCSENLANHNSLSMLADFGADAYYIISYKNSPYLEAINFALQRIKANSDFENNLYHKYYGEGLSETTLQLTTKEREYIANSPVIRIGMNLSRAPFCEYDSKTDTYSGINVDILNEISSKTGLQFEFVAQTPATSVVDLMATGNYDAICGIERDNFKTNETLNSTDSFLESTIVPVGKPGTDMDFSSSLRVAILSSFAALSKKLETDYPNLIVTGYTTNEDCLNAVLAGDADVFIQNTHIISKFLQEPKYESLEILPVDIMTEHTAIVIPRDDAMLMSILNKAIDNIDSATVSGILIKHTLASPYKYTFLDFLYRFRLQLIIAGILVGICFLLLVSISINKEKTAKKMELINESLEKAIAKADSANAAKSQFLAQMSHEIRTPMNAIIGLTSIAKTEIKSPEKVDDYLTKIDGSSKLLLNIINDVLDMSAIEGGKLKIDNAPFNFKQMLTNITTVFYQQARMKGVEFNVRMNGVTEETIVGDELRLNQVLMNFLSNAVKFTPSGGEIDLMVLQASRTRDKVQLRFSVSDTGCGMSEDMMSRLFKPFEQESASTARKHGGSGLGLSIAKNLVEMMGGSIKVESFQGKGSVFTADIPFGTVNQATVADASGFSEIRTLVVDDDKESCEYSGILLERLGVRFDYVTSGEEALDTLGEAEDKGDPYKLCLIDWKMPDMDGIQVTQKIREIFGEDTIVINVSAYDLNELENTGKAAGANYFIPKPLFQSTLFNALMKISGGNYTKIDAEEEKKTFDFTGKRVLVAEDVALNMEVAIKLLQMVGIETVCAEDGRQAVDLFKKADPGTYDCILMDINMPIMDGYEAAKAIRSMPRTDAPYIPIYAMTANAFSEDVTAALNAGMNGHIAKPIETRVLYKTLETAFSMNEK